MRSKRGDVEKIIRKKKEVWVGELVKKAGCSYATALKWLLVLQAEGKVHLIKKGPYLYVRRKGRWSV